MNCQTVQNQILSLRDPRELPAALREHVRECSTCQTWARQAARLESLLAELPAPIAPENKKAALLGDLMVAEPLIRPAAVPAQRPGFGLAAARFFRQNAAVVGGLAAAVFIAIGIYSVWPTPQTNVVHAPTQKHPLLERIVAGNTAMARADTPARKLEVLGGMAGDLADETRGMARIASGAELRQMAGWYDKVVKDGIVKQAGSLPLHMPAAEKAKLLEPLAEKLNADAAATESLAGESPQDAQPALRRIVDTAREGEKALRAAARGEN